jgi:hypothetical protein
MPDNAVAASHFIELSPADRRFAEYLSIRGEIHPHDFIFQFHLRRMGRDLSKAVHAYYRAGYYSANLFKTDVLPEITRLRTRLGKMESLHTLLDFASGYGAVARHFRTILPELEVTTCDIHDEANSFNAKMLGLRAVASASDPRSVRLPTSDIIIALSFFSHMPDLAFRSWLQILSRSLRSGGALVFTTRGYTTHTISPTGVVLDSGSGFGFRPVSEQGDLNGEEYGTTVSLPHYVHAALSECDGMRVAVLREGLWWNSHDMYICMKE